MHHAFGVHSGERTGNLHTNVRSATGVDGPINPVDLGKTASRQILHDQPPPITVSNHIKDGDHVGVMNPSPEPSLTTGLLPVAGTGELEGHDTAQLKVGSAPDLPHPTCTNNPLKPIPPGDDIPASHRSRVITMRKPP
jgi:hypothetical protein